MKRFTFSKLPVILGVIAFVFLIGGVLLIRSGITQASESSIIVDLERLPPNNELQSGDQPETLLVPILTIPDDNSYQEHRIGNAIESTHKDPVAQLQEVDESLIQRADIALTEHDVSTDSEKIAYYVSSTIRYEMKDGVVYVSTTRLSPAAQKIPISFSGDLIKLNNGVEAWMDVRIESEVTPRAINYIDGDFIITVTGNVSEEQLEDLAAKIIITNK